MVRRSIASLLLASIAALAGCTDENVAASPSTFEGQEETSVPAASIDEKLIGTFRGQEVAIGEMMLLVLKADGTSHWGMAIVCATKPLGCGPVQEDGYFRVSGEGAVHYLDLIDWKGNTRATFQYVAADDTLRMRRVDTGGQWRAMERSEQGWCGAAADCGLQNLPTEACIGDWMCAENACNFQCEPRPCEVHDGTCQVQGSTEVLAQE